METESDQQAEEAARDILSQGIRSVLVKRGTNGSLLIDKDGSVIKQPIFRADKVGSHTVCSSAMFSVRSIQFSQCLSAPVQKGFFALQVVDTTGAGDCFTGAYAVAVLEGKTAEEALNFAGRVTFDHTSG